MMRRNWPQRLCRLVNARYNSEFIWGVHDCALFACDAVETMTGTDPGPFFRGRYTSEIGAYKALRRYLELNHVEHDKREDLLRLVAQSCLELYQGWKLVESLRVTPRGTIGLFPSPQPGLIKSVLGVCTGETFVVPSTEGGLTSYPRDRLLAAWRP